MSRNRGMKKGFYSLIEKLFNEKTLMKHILLTSFFFVLLAKCLFDCVRMLYKERIC